jgi:hypothetical protein
MAFFTFPKSTHSPPLNNFFMAKGFITLAQAVEMTSRFRDNKASVVAPSFSGQDILANSDTFDKNGILALLEKSNCAALRLYYGMGTDLKIRPIMVAVDSNDEDIIDGDETAVDDTIRCPPICPVSSPLNS